ncbi:MAG: methyl-accepting chemotaxis protein [Methanosarcinales archaeon]|nr:MAG: methyl-accepting chemotaxis protein [Methanosarcinales archaeon]
MNILNNMSVNKKLMAGFALVLLLTAGLGITAYSQVTTMNNAVVALEHAEEVNTLIGEVRQQEKNYQLRGDQSAIDKNAELIAAVEHNLAAILPLATSEEKAIIADGETRIATYEAAFAELVKETGEMHAVEEECAAAARVIESSIKGATYLDAATMHALMLDLMVVRRDEKNFIMRGDEKSVSDMGAAISTLKAAIDASELTASDKSTIRAEVGAYQATFAELVKIEDQVHAYVATTGPLVTDGRAVKTRAEELAESAIARAEAAAASAKSAVVAFVVIAIVLGILIATVISKSITSPLNEVMIGANKIRDGDFGYEIKIDSKDELGDLARTFGEMKGNIQAIVGETERISREAAGGNLTVKPEIELKGDYNNLGNAVDGLVGVLSNAVTDSRNVGERVLATAQGISSAAEEMNAGMEQLASSSQQVAEGSQKLAELAQTTARDVEEVSSQIAQTSANASSSAEKGQNAVNETNEVQEAAQKTLDGLAQIQEGVAKTSETVSEMNTAIEKVGEMGEVITDVAGQTNMLGLNAAIEAARAGEAGRGFAVVADAVKNLAEKVKEAAGESGLAIDHIQESGENAIGATGTAVEEATQGGELLHVALEGITTVAGSIDEVNLMVQEIDSGAKNIAKVVKGVVVGMDEVASISEESASAAEESSAAVQQQTSAIEELTSETQVLTDVAQDMMNELGRFTVRE